MIWEHPQLLYLVAPLALLVLGLTVWGEYRRQVAAGRLALPEMRSRIAPAPHLLRLAVKSLIAGVAVVLLMIAAAGPRNIEKLETVSARGVDLFILLDVSRSMMAEDVAPNRMDRAKSDIRDLLKKLEGDRVGLIAFAGAAVIQVPLTSDHRFLINALEAVDTDSAPRGGSLIGDAIRTATDAMNDNLEADRDRVIVLITDGEDHDSYPEEAAREAAEKKIKVFTIGLGDATEGTRIPLRDASGELQYLQHDGQEIWSRMDERLLKEIALATGGDYVPARTRSYDLGELYENHLAQLTRGEYESQQKKRKQLNILPWALPGLILLLLDQLIRRYPSYKASHSSRP